MENKLKSFFIMYWYLRRTFFSKTGPKPPKKKKERGINVRICSPSLALKKKKIQSSRKVLLLVLSGANMCPSSLWPLPVTPDPCHSCAELWPAELSIICRHHEGVTEPHTWLVVTSEKPHLPVRKRQIKDTVTVLTPFLLSSLNTKTWTGSERRSSSSDYQRHCEQPCA